MVLDRRELFKRGFGRAVDMAVKEVEHRANENARHWIRPPYALDELDFLIKCTRCSDCIDACPHYVLFPLQPRTIEIFPDVPPRRTVSWYILHLAAENVVVAVPVEISNE